MIPQPDVESLIGREVVLDASSMFVYVGTLTRIDDRTIILEDADVHDLRDTNTTREMYVIDASRHGVQANRKIVYVRADEIVSISPLDDVIA